MLAFWGFSWMGGGFVFRPSCGGWKTRREGGRKKILINEHYFLVVNISGVEDYGKTSTCPSGGVDVRGGWALGGIMLGICGCSFGTWFLFSRNDWAGLRLICIGTQEGSAWFGGGGGVDRGIFSASRNLHCYKQIWRFPNIFYLIDVELSFLAETWRHVLGLGLLLNLVLEKQILSLRKQSEESNANSNKIKKKFQDKLMQTDLEISWYLIGFHERLVKLRLKSGSYVATVAVEERVCAMTSHGGRIPVLNNPRSSSNPTAWDQTEKKKKILPYPLILVINTTYAKRFTVQP